ncbi:MAG: TolC family protein, partial [Saprospiraceae bacterium]|nr:TolC family protein [Saprospiraceae bacterium]
MLNYLKVSLLLLLLMIGLNSLISQSINIGIIYDEVSDSDLEIEYEGNLKEEIFQLLHHRYEIQFNSYFGSKEGTDYNTAFTEAYLKNDVVIALGNLSSNYAITRNDFPKPTISAIVLDSELQGLIKTENGTSGINNFTYTESPFDIERDLNILYEIYPFDHLEVITEEGTIGEVSFMKQLFANYLKGKDVTVDHIYYKTQIADHFNDMEGAKVAVYALPYLGSDENLVQSIFQTINDNKVPSAALFGEEYIQNGALAAYETGGNLQKIPRLIALSLMKILEGQNAADLSVEMQSFGENLMINMETARQIGVYPNFDIMNSATLINLENIQTDNKINLQQALGIALNKNLSIKIEEADIQIADTETSIAKSELLPQLDVSSTFLVKDEISTLASQGAQGRANWIFSGNLSQIIFAEPALANVAIQKLLKKNEESQYYQTQ